MVDFVYPEDGGTNSNLGSTEGDFNDAANFAAAFEAIGKVDFVGKGLNLQNVSSGTFDLSKGKAVLTDTSAVAGQSNDDRDEGVAYVVELDARTGLSYTTGSVNYVFVDVPLTDNDVINIEVNTTDTAPSQPSLKIAEIDDSGTLTTTEFNRRPTGTFESISNKNYNEDTVTIGSASGTTDLDLSQANLFRVEAVDNITITFSNFSSSPAGNSVVVYVVDSDGAGPYTISWPSAVVWNNGNAVGEVAQNSNIEASLLTDNGGTEIRGRLSGEAFA